MKDVAKIQIYCQVDSDKQPHIFSLENYKSYPIEREGVLDRLAHDAALHLEDELKNNKIQKKITRVLICVSFAENPGHLPAEAA